jgi:hypothetical protein
MTFNVKVNPNPETKIVAKVATGQGFISPQTLTIKNQLREYQINSIEDLPDVDEVNVTDGAMLIYNQATDKYEVKELTQEFFVGSIDGGEF